MKIRDAKPEELVRPALARKLSPRQKIAQEREAKFRKLLESLSDPAQIKAIEPEKGEKLGTLRASLTKVLQGDHRGAHLAVKRGVIYVSLGPIPGGSRTAPRLWGPEWDGLVRLWEGPRRLPTHVRQESSHNRSGG